MNTLVTGSSGFIGQHLCEALQKRGDKVIRLPRDFFMRPDLLEDFLDKKSIQVIYHLAAYGNMAHQKDPFDMISANYINTFNLLQATKDILYKAFINVSSSSVLLSHETMYSATKAGAERLCKVFVDEYHKPIVIIRPYSVYGPREASFRFIPTAFRSCLEGEPMSLDPDAVHDWVYIDDLIKDMIESSELADRFKGISVNCGTGIGHTNKQVIHLIEKITGKKAVIEKRKVFRTYDNKEWINNISIPAYTTLEAGLRKYYHWYMGLSK